MTRLNRAIREAVVLLVVAAALGFISSAIRGKGVFASPPGHKPSASPEAMETPEMINLPEARGLFDSGRALFIDARHEFEYTRGHIPGALNLPIGEFDDKTDFLGTLPKDKVLVTYCDGVECNSSIGLATKLHEAGFSGVKIFFAGWNEWTAQNLPTEEGNP